MLFLLELFQFLLPSSFLFFLSSFLSFFPPFLSFFLSSFLPTFSLSLFLASFVFIPFLHFLRICPCFLPCFPSSYLKNFSLSVLCHYMKSKHYISVIEHQIPQCCSDQTLYHSSSHQQNCCICQLRGFRTAVFYRRLDDVPH